MRALAVALVTVLVALALGGCIVEGTWVVAPIADEAATPVSVSCPTADMCVVGLDRADGTSALVHWDGTTWPRCRATAPAGPRRGCRAGPPTAAWAWCTRGRSRARCGTPRGGTATPGR